jgi:TRAP-type C4-dicarboxylate transport system substrate-binding protein
MGASTPPPAQPLRVATIAVDGTLWARLFRQFGDEVEQQTNGSVRFKWYFGTAAGDELTTLARVGRGELDAVVGSSICERVAPSLRALEVAGLVQSDEEAIEVLRRLRPRFEEESRNTPFVLLGEASIGHRVLFTRTPVATLAELRRGRYWVYDFDDVMRSQLPLMGVNIVPLSFNQAAPAYDERRVDGFFSIPAAAVYYRYGVKARYFLDLGGMNIPGCVIFSRPLYNTLSAHEQKVLREAAERLGTRITLDGHKQDQDLMERIFPEHGLRPVAMNDAFRREFVETGLAANARLGGQLVPLDLARRVAAITSEVRAERHQPVRSQTRAHAPQASSSGGGGG